jgi:hypothetical protein
MKMETEEVRNAIIRKATITNEDHGILSAWLDMDYGGAGQSFGGYVLYNPNFRKDVAGFFIWRVLEVADVTEWGKLPGRTIRVKSLDERILAIGHIVKDIWFDPKEMEGRL